MKHKVSVLKGFVFACVLAVYGASCPEARAQEIPAERLALAVDVADAMHISENFRELMMASRSSFIMAVRQGGYDEPAAARIWDLYVQEWTRVLPLLSAKRQRRMQEPSLTSNYMSSGPFMSRRPGKLLSGNRSL